MVSISSLKSSSTQQDVNFVDSGRQSMFWGRGYLTMVCSGSLSSTLALKNKMPTAVKPVRLDITLGLRVVSSESPST